MPRAARAQSCSSLRHSVQSRTRLFSVRLRHAKRVLCVLAGRADFRHLHLAEFRTADPRSCLQGHSGISRASFRHSGAARGGDQRATLIPNTVLPVYWCDRAVLFSRQSAPDAPRVPVSEGSQLSVVMRPRRSTDTSRRPPIGWPPRGPGVRRPRVMSGLLERRPLCRSTSHQASVRETPNVEADPRQNSSGLNCAATPATIDPCWNCSS